MQYIPHSHTHTAITTVMITLLPAQIGILAQLIHRHASKQLHNLGTLLLSLLLHLLARVVELSALGLQECDAL